MAVPGLRGRQPDFPLRIEASGRGHGVWGLCKLRLPDGSRAVPVSRLPLVLPGGSLAAPREQQLQHLECRGPAIGVSGAQRHSHYEGDQGEVEQGGETSGLQSRDLWQQHGHSSPSAFFPR
jgi:hypothetical protein